MKAGRTAGLPALAVLVALIVAAPGPAGAGAMERPDVIWARSTAGAAITLDGVLNEPAWNQAESMTIRYAYDTGIPGSGWKAEGGFAPGDSTRATLKFLTAGNQLYIAFMVPDSSIGGSASFNFFDGLLMAIKDHASLNRPAPPAEYFYSWWYPEDPSPTAPGKLPAFVGRWGSWPPGTPRTPEAINNWDAGITVNGTTNADATLDQGYTVEMRFNLTPMGYDITQAGGDIIEWNVSIYDCDWFWPVTMRVSANRVWWQGPWGNNAVYNEVRIHARPDVTINSGALPSVGNELTIPNVAGPTPVIDGQLTDAAWASAGSFDIRYGDQTLRDSYPGIGKWRAGQYQPPVNGGEAFILDPSDATVKWFVSGDSLFLGFDVRDQVVQYHPEFDRWDGFLVSLNERVVREPQDHVLLGRRLGFHVGPSGEAVKSDYLPFLADTLFGARVAIHLNPGTVLDTLGQSADNGYQAEMVVDLTKLGYPAGLGDRILFIGINLLDGDSFTPFTDSYGSRTWVWREYENTCCPPWAYMQPGGQVSVDDPPVAENGRFALLGSYPNPFGEAAVIRYALAERVAVTLDVFDPAGRLVRSQAVGVQDAGLRSAALDGAGLARGVYLYRLRMTDPASGAERAVLSGKAMLLR